MQRRPSNVDGYLRWQTNGEWRFFDPWEEPRTSVTAEEASEFRERFLQECEPGSDPTSRDHAVILTADNEPVGFANRYEREVFTDAWYPGISICEDGCLNHGLGTEALRLWVYYLFTTSEIHCLGLDCWSNNPRMKGAAEKAGFVYEGKERELLAWQGERLNLDHYGLLRSEWTGCASSCHARPPELGVTPGDGEAS